MEATREAAKELGLSRLGLFGVRFTMQGHFYSDVFSKAGITLVVPEENERVYIHDKYMKLERHILARNTGTVAGDCRPAGQAGARTRVDSGRNGAAANFTGSGLRYPVSRCDPDSREGCGTAVIVSVRKRA